MSRGIKERLNAVLGLVRTVVHWGYIPAIIYLGTCYLKKGVRDMWKEAEKNFMRELETLLRDPQNDSC